MTYTPLIKKTVKYYPKEVREDLIQDLEIFYLLLPDEKKTPQYLKKVIPLRCSDFFKNYLPKTDSLDDFLYQDDEEILRKCDLIEAHEELEQSIIIEDQIQNLRLTPIEKKIQTWYYFEGYSVKEIIELYQPLHFIQSEKTIYNILRKGA